VTDLKAGEASRTAEFNALFRALESSRRPKHKRLFEDPLAREFLGRLKYAYLLSHLPLAGRLVTMHIDRKWPGVRASHLARTCWIDDRLRAALNNGVGQIVILGAGYDCRAFRLPGIERIRVFELDHPSTLIVKVERLKHLLGDIPRHVTFVELDLSRQDPAVMLETSGFDRSIPSFFLMEGLMHYLTEEAVDAIMRSIALLAIKGSRLVFTYIHRGLLDGSINFGATGSVPATLRKSGETWTFGFHPDEIRAYLEERGFDLVVDIGACELRAHYMGPSGQHLKGFEFYRAVLAGKSA
jgi:methyltransferase (TIGR00027 family)